MSRIWIRFSLVGNDILKCCFVQETSSYGWLNTLKLTSLEIRSITEIAVILIFCGINTEQCEQRKGEKHPHKTKTLCAMHHLLPGERARKRKTNPLCDRCQSDQLVLSQKVLGYYVYENRIRINTEGNTFYHTLFHR